MTSFPDGFLWGVATAAHQVEGNNVGCDAWLMEHLPGSVYREPSGDKAGHFRMTEELFRDDAYATRCEAQATAAIRRSLAAASAPMVPPAPPRLSM